MTKVKSLAFALLYLSSLVLFSGSVYGEEGAHDSSHHSEDLMRGQRLFHGLVDGKFEAQACADCHNTVEIDTFNWNPNAWEIAHQYKSRSIEDFTKAVLNPSGSWGLIL